MGYDPCGIGRKYSGTTSAHHRQEDDVVEKQGHQEGKGPMEPLYPLGTNVGDGACNA